MKQFDYQSPSSLSGVIEAMSSHEGKAKLIAGGTDIVCLMTERALTPDLLVSLKGVTEYRAISETDGKLRIGALCTLNQVAESDLIRDNYPFFSEAILQMASDQIRNRATIGGNICNASPAGDTLAPLLTLDAELVLAGAEGTRTVTLADFITGPGETSLQPGEVLTEIVIPVNQGAVRGLYIKHGRRRALEACLVGVAVCMSYDSDAGAAKNVRLAISACAPIPKRVPEAEQVLEGNTPSEDLIAKAAEAMRAAADPISDVRASREYRLEMVGVLAFRAIATTIAELRQE